MFHLHLSAVVFEFKDYIRTTAQGQRKIKREESTTIRTTGGLDFTAIGGKRQGY
ncbi:MAG: hypothetical protein PVG35_00120 [Desulfobacterales bacterium]|jgi:hypothetical protein